MVDPNSPVGALTRLIGRTTLPFGLIFLAVAVFYVGYLALDGTIGPLQLLWAVLAGVSSVIAIYQGRQFRRDPRFR
jgi:hypothetical protein